MNLGTVLPGAAVFWISAMLCSGAVIVAACRAPWRSLVEKSERQHFVFAALMGTPLLWSLRIGIENGVYLHLLGMTLLTLVFGWELAILIGAVSSMVLVVFEVWPWQALGFNGLLTTVVPVAVTAVFLHAVSRLRRGNLFVYLLGAGFAGGVFSLLASMVLGSWLLGWQLDHAMALLLTFPEGFLDGAVVTALTIFYPSIMRTYDDVRYLGEP